MIPFIIYIALASFCLSLFYFGYRLIFRNETNFAHARIYLLLSIGLSLVIPLNNLRIDTGLFANKSANMSFIVVPDQQQTAQTATVNEANTTFWDILRNNSEKLISIAVGLYLTIMAILLLRIFVQLIILIAQYIKSDKVRKTDCVLLYNHRFRNTFSFFRWIFMLKNIASDDEFDQIITHEKIHVYQYHSLDLMVIELLAAAMWFNPFIRSLKKSMQLVHEYLADKGTLDSGIDRLRYQALLINQVSEERLVCLSSSFNHSLIKKRIIMMTTSKSKKEKKLRIYAILPLSAFIIFTVALLNGIITEDTKASVPVQEILLTAESGPGNMLFIAPPDTIIKKKIVKKVYKDNPQDTIVEESEEMIISEGDLKHEKFSWQEGESGDKKVIIRHSGDNEEFSWSESSSGDKEKHVSKKVMVVHGDDDSVKVYKFHSTDDDDADEVIMHSKKVRIEHSDDMDNSRILWIIDGVKHTEKDALEGIDPDAIQTIEVVKKDKAQKYTTEDYDAVIVVTSKKK